MLCCEVVYTFAELGEGRTYPTFVIRLEWTRAIEFAVFTGGRFLRPVVLFRIALFLWGTDGEGLITCHMSPPLVSQVNAQHNGETA
jgi:hypothetical protein